MSGEAAAPDPGAPRVELWLEYASTYSYPVAMRAEAEARAAGVALVWRPFLLGPLFREQGWEDSPFNLYPAKGRYMWRDLERLCARQGLPFRRPSAFPRSGLLAARVALLAEDEGWVADWTRAVFHAEFAEDRDIGAPAVLAALLRAKGRDAEALLERARAPETKARLRERTEEARRRGLFGAPSFWVAGELFWGGDRFAEALAWARGDRPPLGGGAG